MCHKSIVFAFLVYFFENSKIGASTHPGFVDIVNGNGYNGESHHVTTEDGYNLRIDRIAGSPSSPPSPGKPVVLLQHGLFGSSDFFVFMNPADSLSYILADAGYDIWVTNIRGNSYGRSHVRLSPDEPAFWNYTLHDIATKDLPAGIDFILARTRQSCLVFIGHSMGTTLSFILLSEIPKFNEKISLLISLAPVVLWFHNGMGHLGKFGFEIFVEALHKFRESPDYAVEIMSRHNPVIEKSTNFCDHDNNEICIYFMNHIYGLSGTPLNSHDIRILSAYAPAGTSLKVVEHYRQQIHSGKFRNYKYETRARNIAAYGTPKPPVYNLQKVTTKVALIWVHNDSLGHKKNIRKLSRQLKNIVAIEPVASDQFHHADFLFFKGGRRLIHNRILGLVEQYHKCNGTHFVGNRTLIIN